MGIGYRGHLPIGKRDAICAFHLTLLPQNKIHGKDDQKP